MAGRVGPGRMVVRGFARRCPRCGARKLFHSLLKMKERCPRCGLRFEREEGFFLGAYVVNFVVAEGLVGVVLFVAILYAVNNPGTSFVPYAVVGMVLAIVGPVLFFPNARTVWAALDLAARPLDPGEEADAAAHGHGEWSLAGTEDSDGLPDS